MLIACVHEMHDEVGLLDEEVVVRGNVQSIVHEPRLPFLPKPQFSQGMEGVSRM